MEEEAKRLIKEEEERKAHPTALSPVEESDGSVSSHVSHSNDEKEDSIPKLADGDVVRVLEDLKKGDYDHNIMELWKTVDMTQYDVKNHSVELSSAIDP